MEKLQLVNFIAKIMEESDFKVYKDFKTSQRIIDIYGVLPTIMGDFRVVVACKNYDKQWEVGIDILKEMEMIARRLKASQIAIITSSSFSSQSRSYASRKNIKLIDRDNLILLAKKFSKKGASLAKGNSDDSNHNIIYNDSNTNDIDYENEGHDINHDYNNSEILNNVDRVENYPKSYSKKRLENSKINHLNNKLSSSSSKSRLSRFNQKNILNKHERKEPTPPISEVLKPIFSNTFILIFLVVTISYLISSLLMIVLGVSKGISGLVKIMLSLLLSYGLVFGLDKEGTAVLVKGTTVFFISLIILILMIIFL